MKRMILFFALLIGAASAEAQKDDDGGVKAFLKRNKAAKDIHWKGSHQLVIDLKSGGQEVYDLDDEKQRNAATAKYGILPVAPPPPPPIPGEEAIPAAPPTPPSKEPAMPRPAKPSKEVKPAIPPAPPSNPPPGKGIRI